MKMENSINFLILQSKEEFYQKLLQNFEILESELEKENGKLRKSLDMTAQNLLLWKKRIQQTNSLSLLSMELMGLLDSDSSIRIVRMQLRLSDEESLTDLLVILANLDIRWNMETLILYLSACQEGYLMEKLSINLSVCFLKKNLRIWVSPALLST